MILRLAIVLALLAFVGGASAAWRRREGRFSEAGGAFDRAELGLTRAERPSAVVVEFSGEHCGSCRVVETRLARLAGEIPEVRIVTLDADERSEIASRYDVRRVPTLFVTDPDLRIVWRATGVPSEDAIREALLGPDWAGRPHPTTQRHRVLLRRRARATVRHDEGIACDISSDG